MQYELVNRIVKIYLLKLDAHVRDLYILLPLTPSPRRYRKISAFFYIEGRRQWTQLSNKSRSGYGVNLPVDTSGFSRPRTSWISQTLEENLISGSLVRGFALSFGDSSEFTSYYP